MAGAAGHRPVLVDPDLHGTSPVVWSLRKREPHALALPSHRLHQQGASLMAEACVTIGPRLCDHWPYRRPPRQYIMTMDGWTGTIDQAATMGLDHDRALTARTPPVANVQSLQAGRERRGGCCGTVHSLGDSPRHPASPRRAGVARSIRLQRPGAGHQEVPRQMARPYGRLTPVTGAEPSGRRRAKLV
jgi:hypothetical protein